MKIIKELSRPKRIRLLLRKIWERLDPNPNYKTEYSVDWISYPWAYSKAMREASIYPSEERRKILERREFKLAVELRRIVLIREKRLYDLSLRWEQ